MVSCVWLFIRCATSISGTIKEHSTLDLVFYSCWWGIHQHKHHHTFLQCVSSKNRWTLQSMSVLIGRIATLQWCILPNVMLPMCICTAITLLPLVIPLLNFIPVGIIQTPPSLASMLYLQIMEMVPVFIRNVVSGLWVIVATQFRSLKVWCLIDTNCVGQLLTLCPRMCYNSCMREWQLSGGCWWRWGGRCVIKTPNYPNLQRWQIDSSLSHS